MITAPVLANPDFAELVDGLNAALNSMGYGDWVPGPILFKEKLDVDRFMFVFNYDYKLSSDFTLFFNGGLGVLNAEHTLYINLKTEGAAGAPPVDASSKSKSDETVFAYQLGAGLGYHFTETVSLYGQVRYLASMDIDFNHDGYKYDAKGSAIAYELGLQYRF